VCSTVALSLHMLIVWATLYVTWAAGQVCPTDLRCNIHTIVPLRSSGRKWAETVSGNGICVLWRHFCVNFVPSSF
jgi:hypothetical protein